MQKYMRLMACAALGFLFVQPGHAAETKAESSVIWQAEIIKKTEVELNVFASGDKLQFKWNPSAKAFTKPSSSLLIQAAGKAGSTAYSITAQMKRNKIPHTEGLSSGVVEISANLGGVVFAADKPVLILDGTDKGIKSAAIGLENMNLAVAGPNITPKGTYHQADNVPLTFEILKGKDRSGTDLVLGGTANGLDKLSDGAYSGTVEMVFAASWS